MVYAMQDFRIPGRAKLMRRNAVQHPELRVLSLSGISVLVILIFAVSVCADVKVRGYRRSDGTYVRSHYRSNPDGIFSNNWSTYGNRNPYTGRMGTKRHPSSGYSGERYYYQPTQPSVNPLAPHRSQESVEQELARVDHEVNAEVELLRIEEEAWDTQIEFVRRFGEQEIEQQARTRRAKFDEHVRQWEAQQQTAFEAEANARRDAFDKELKVARQMGQQWIPKNVSEKVSVWDAARRSEQQQRDSTYLAGTERIRKARAELIAKYGEARLAVQIRQWKKDDAWRHAQMDVEIRVANQNIAEERAEFVSLKTVEARNRVEATLSSMEAKFQSSQSSHREQFAREMASAKQSKVADFEVADRELVAQQQAELNQRMLALNESRLDELSSRSPGNNDLATTAIKPNIQQVNWDFNSQSESGDPPSDYDWRMIEVARGALLCIVACGLIWAFARSRRKDVGKAIGRNCTGS